MPNQQAFHEPVPGTTPRPARRILFLSNGHGEDEIGASLIGALRAREDDSVAIDAWAMVGRGVAYVAAGAPLVGTPNLLPSEGFGTLSVSAFARDLRAGWLGVHLRQLHAARALRGRYDLVIAIGDVVPLLAAELSRAPFAFVGCAKSVYYGPRYGYGALERWLLRRRCVACYARDARTAEALLRAGVPARYLGNPMMDRVPVRGIRLAEKTGATIVACLSGSRSDREKNAATILGFIGAERKRYEEAGLTHFVFAVPQGFDVAAMWRAVRQDSGPLSQWTLHAPVSSTDEPVSRAGCGQLLASFVSGALGDVLQRARVAIGLAGTANEQAVGFGVPVVTFATAGAQGDHYLRMKMPFFGESAIRVPPEPRVLADAVIRVSTDDALRARMARAGRERMGRPGASAAIVADLLSHLRNGAHP